MESLNEIYAPINPMVNEIYALISVPGFLSGFCPRGGKMTYYSTVGGGKNLSVPGVDLQCTCHVFNTGVLTDKKIVV